MSVVFNGSFYKITRRNIMLKNKLLALITAPLLLITFTSVASAAENNSLGEK